MSFRATLKFVDKKIKIWTSLRSFIALGLFFSPSDHMNVNNFTSFEDFIELLNDSESQ